MTVSGDEFRHSRVAVNGSDLHVVEAGDPSGPPFLFLHGWPQSWRSWQQVMRVAASQVRAVAIDLPGVGSSTGAATDGSKRQIADVVHHLVGALDLRDVTLVGHDVGGMVVYAYLRAYEDLARAVIMNVSVPGVEPWEELLRNPKLWHFALHAIPALPERLVQGKQAEYFDFFYDVLTSDPAKITAEARAEYVDAYATDQALTAGFNWYRGFERDAEDNRQAGGSSQLETPLLYLRGERESGDVATYRNGFRAAGVAHVRARVIPGAMHFAPEEAPESTWRLIADFAGLS